MHYGISQKENGVMDHSKFSEPLTTIGRVIISSSPNEKSPFTVHLLLNKTKCGQKYNFKAKFYYTFQFAFS